jgi:methyl-CpG-binding domain protein 4
MIEPLRDDLMVQQQLPAEPGSRTWCWQHMVAVIMLNQTGRKPVKTVLPVFLDRWPEPWDLYIADDQDIQDVIWPLGLVNVRLKRLVRMTQEFFVWKYRDGDARDLYGIGKYGSDSYEIFFRHNYSVQPTDKELRRYLENLAHEPAHQ